MIKEEWAHWHPANKLDELYWVNLILSENNSLIIKLSSNEKDGKSIQLLFKKGVAAYRYTNESFSLKLCWDLSDKYSNDFYNKWTFFKVRNSDYMNLFLEQSDTYINADNLIHFAILGGDEVVDIIATEEPIFTFAKSNDK